MLAQLAALRMDKTLPVYERLQSLVLQHIVPFSQPSNSALFNQLVGQPKVCRRTLQFQQYYVIARLDGAYTVLRHKVKAYFGRTETAFRRIYKLFAAADEEDDDNLSMLNLKEFTTYVHDCQLQTSCGMTGAKARKIFTDVVGLSAAENGDVAELDLEEGPQMVFADFLLSTCALCMYRYPDPFVPLDAKLDLFEANDIGHVLQQSAVVLREDM